MRYLKFTNFYFNNFVNKEQVQKKTSEANQTIRNDKDGWHAIYMQQQSATPKVLTSENKWARLAADEKVGPYGMTF